jgi:hypothetical protein
MATGVYFLPSQRRAVSAFPVDMLDREDAASPFGPLGALVSPNETVANAYAGENGVVYRVRLAKPQPLQLSMRQVGQWMGEAEAVSRGQLPLDHFQPLRAALIEKGYNLLTFAEGSPPLAQMIVLNPGDLEIAARRHMLLDIRGLSAHAQKMTEMEFRGLHRLNQKRIVNLLRSELEKPDLGPAVGRVHRPGVEARIARFEKIIDGGWNAQVEQLRAIADAPAPLPETDDSPGF